MEILSRLTNKSKLYGQNDIRQWEDDEPGQSRIKIGYLSLTLDGGYWCE